MSEGISSGTSSNSGGALRRAFTKFMIISLFIYGAQLLLHEPGDRAVAACWPPYLVTRLAMVKGPEIFMPKEHTLILENTFRVENWNRRCIAKVEDWTWLKAKESPLSSK